MSDSTRAQLQQAYQLIKSGQRDEAVSVIRSVITVDPNNADAWWLMANAATDTSEQRRALETVVRLRPDHAQARAKLDALTAADTFSFDEPDSFGGLMGEKPKRGLPDSHLNPPNTVFVQPAKSGTNPLVIILAVIGVIAVLVCAGCFFVSTQLTAQVGQVFSDIVGSVTAMPEVFGTLGAFNAENELSDINGLENKGSVGVGESKSDSLNDSFEYHGYTFNGETGQSITIDVAAEGADDLDTKVALYAPSGDLVSANDDIEFGENRDSRLTVTLPSTGEYTIVVSSFASEGRYTLRVS